MTGPYEYVPPVYWLTDKDRGGAFGFNTETSPGAAVPPVESLRKFLPPEHLWPVDEYWNFHASRWARTANDLRVHNRVLEMRYGPATSLKDYVLKSQVIAYESERAMFEAYGRNKYTSTGVIQWMLNNAWPSVIWHLYDYYLRPGGGYFGTKKGCEPLHIQYSYDDQSVAVVNSYYRNFGKLKVSAWVYNLDMKEQFSKQVSVGIPSDSVTKVFLIPRLSSTTTTYFLRLALEDLQGRQISSNFYWLSRKPDVLDWDNGNGRYTPEKSFADFTDLRTLPQIKLKLFSRNEYRGSDGITHVIVENPSKDLAFFIHLRVAKGKNGEEVLPVRWEDNYISLVPGEGREISATYKRDDLQSETPIVILDGWNVNEESQASRPAR
jgi:exo-1,4-beta-D-glucosaminidase